MNLVCSTALQKPAKTTKESINYNKHSLQLARAADGDAARSAAGRAGALLLHLLDDILALNDFTEDDVLAIKMGSRDELYNVSPLILEAW